MDEIRTHLVRQLQEPVQWESIMRAVCAEEEVGGVLQVGGGSSLLSLLHKMQCPHTLAAVQ